MNSFCRRQRARRRVSYIFEFVLFGISLCMCSLVATAQTPFTPAKNWQGVLHQTLPLLGHRNWILIVDSAYPLQSSPGVQTIETGAGEIEVVKDVLNAIKHSIHVRPVVYMDAELPFVPESDAPGVSGYRKQIKSVLGNDPVISVPHERLLQKVKDAGRDFHVLIFKTNQTIPYTSVFLQLNCKYWSDAAEAHLRAKMKRAGGGSQ